MTEASGHEGEARAEAVTGQVSNEPRCPQCGGTARRTWGDVTGYIFCTFFIFLFLAPIVFFTCMGSGLVILRLGVFLWFGVVLISFWAMPVAGALAVVTPPRCRDCGHLCRTPSGDRNETDGPHFPWRCALIDEVILLAIVVAGLCWLGMAPGLETSIMGLRFQLWMVLAGCALGVGLFAQAKVWRRRRARVTNAGRDGRVLLLTTVVVGAGWLVLMAGESYYLSRTYDPVKRAPAVLDRAGLAALPASARDVRVYAWAFMLSGEYTLRFTAEPDGIEQFLADSPSLATEGAPERKRLDTSDRPHGIPSWYRCLGDSGRRYAINWYDGKYQGELLVDDETHTVYAHVSRF
jgi:hypothetical protein